MATICETKNSNENVENSVHQLEKYIKAVKTKYSKVISYEQKQLPDGKIADDKEKPIYTPDWEWRKGKTTD